jgi:hypothetical protein
MRGETADGSHADTKITKPTNYRWVIRAGIDAGLVDCFRALDPDAEGFT